MSDILFPTKVFISHSAKDEFASKFLEHLYEVLSKIERDGRKCYEVLLDRKSVPTGTLWREVIDGWVWNCDAAIILLSEDATTSDYVKYEVGYLRARLMAHSNSFTMLPVLFPGVTQDLIKERMKPLQLDEVEYESLDKDDADKVCEKLLSYLAVVRERRGFRHEIEETLFDIFSNSVPSDNHLKKISDMLPIGQIPAGALEDRARAVARTILELSDTLGSARFTKLRSIVEKLRFMVDEKGVREVIWAVSPFCWVNPEAAIKLPAIASGSRAVAWGRSWSLSEQMYLFRAYFHAKMHIVYASDRHGGEPAGEETEAADKKLDSFLTHVISCLWKELMDRTSPIPAIKDYAKTRERLLRRIDNLGKKGEPVFLIIPMSTVAMSTVDEDVIERLRDEWPGVTLFMHEEELTEDEFKAMELSNVEFLSPPLDPDSEDDARADYNDLIKRISDELR